MANQAELEEEFNNKWSAYQQGPKGDSRNPGSFADLPEFTEGIQEARDREVLLEAAVEFWEQLLLLRIRGLGIKPDISTVADLSGELKLLLNYAPINQDQRELMESLPKPLERAVQNFQNMISWAKTDSQGQISESSLVKDLIKYFKKRIAEFEDV